MFANSVQITLLGIALLIAIIGIRYLMWDLRKSETHLYQRINEELSRVHERINNSLDYSNSIVEYFEPRHKELLIDDSNRLFLPSLPIRPAKEDSIDIFYEKSLSNRERNTLLSIIAVLCKDAGYDITKHAKTAGLIHSTAAGMGLSIGETTIEGHLKKIPDAIAGRMK